MTISTDYLVIGAGANGMAFADTLLSETDASITIVDRNAQPGGHWTVAYPFVRLHQPSAYYGVMSRPLEISPPNADGWAELATGPQIQRYFQAVMDEVFLPSGRVRYLPRSEYRDGEIVSLDSGTAEPVTVTRKTIEAGHLGGAVPANNKPAFPVDPKVRFAPVNALGQLEPDVRRYVVLGSGKTGIDACLQLLDSGLSPDAITWVMPRDSWFLDRRFAQPTEQFYELKVRNARDENRALMQASDPDDLFRRLESTGNLLRLDPDVWPSAYKCATVTFQELDRLRSIKAIIRKGHVTEITADRVALTNGEVPLDAQTLVVDCTASGIPDAPEPPIFQSDRIVMNGIRSCQPTFCAALLAHLEATMDDDTAKNDLCKIVPMPREPMDWLRMGFVNRQNQYAWMQSDDLRAWLKTCRLDVLTNMSKPQVVSDDLKAMQAEIRETMIPSTMRMKQLIDMAGG